jgi:hypothetical protein
MHGIIFSELKSYAETKLGRGSWDALLRKANLENRVYLSIREYADSESLSFVMAACALTGLSVSAVLKDFRQFIVPSLLRMYGHLLKPEWGHRCHRQYRRNGPRSLPREEPRGETTEVEEPASKSQRVLLVYTSSRQMCGLAIGIGMGLGQHFGEKLVADQTMCMHKGASRCEILFRKVG